MSDEPSAFPDGRSHPGWWLSEAGDDDWAGAQERFLDHLLSLLGKTCRRVLVVSPEAAAVVASLRGRGLQSAALAPAEASDAERPAPLAEAGDWEAALLLDDVCGEQPPAPLLARLHGLLADNGRLLVAAAVAAPGARAARRAT
ncbi:MAG TPA: hypothetical protein VGV61_01195, partial [Thermoanaerobaculia bacterium]|nr:hypothetical protein [Thermoanaerobaculia bacterium]